MAKLVRVSRVKDHRDEIPFAPQTLFKWHHLGKHAEIFVKIGGALFVDIDKFNSLVESGRQG
jgi:hypothetical protein